MTVKIDRFQIAERNCMGGDNPYVGIVDYLKSVNRCVASFETDDKELNMKLAKLTLDVLNKEFKE